MRLHHEAAELRAVAVFWMAPAPGVLYRGKPVTR
jgi:hypothetical protein